MNYLNYYQSPLGTLLLTSSKHGLTGIHFENGKYISKDTTLYQEKDNLFFDETKRWLDIYFSGAVFRQKIYRILCDIPYGETCSYGAIAKVISCKEKPTRFSQAVGQAVGHNPISIIIPCHRVLGADGSLTGYGGGLTRKRYLLDLEKAKTSTENLLF